MGPRGTQRALMGVGVTPAAQDERTRPPGPPMGKGKSVSVPALVTNAGSARCLTLPLPAFAQQIQGEARRAGGGGPWCTTLVEPNEDRITPFSSNGYDIHRPRMSERPGPARRDFFGAREPSPATFPRKRRVPMGIRRLFPPSTEAGAPP